MGKRLVRLREAWVANRKALFWLFASYIPVGMGSGYLGYWLLHTWDSSFREFACWLNGHLGANVVLCEGLRLNIELRDPSAGHLSGAAF